MMHCTSDESIASVDATEGSPSKQDDDSQVCKERDYNSQKGERARNSGPMLPEVRQYSPLESNELIRLHKFELGNTKY